ncbi:CotS family spore coat protein [Ruminiclostridium cellobioparum]|uniref:Spore coat protein, CotS family n=1 Tax=Ruminiclostridium cellobioparum subsp. termitidis CT1112 TaxID=1195236 RepID=S0FM88_RUMCE|nr:CotS family spore coat protein [Ruminiclostridium cellobioparum]EMS73032.1 spore coat protein, CotS family [Ruminiclostridium cellobioparum subsp. termitidis CT1112]
MHELERELQENYDIRINSISNFRDMFIANTDNGRRLIKITGLKPDRVNFIAEVKEHLFQNGFCNIDRNIFTNSGKSCITYNDQTIYMCRYVEGRESNLDNREESIRCARLLAKMHRASIGFGCSENSSPRNELGRLPSSYRKRLDEIKKLKKNAVKGKMKFDNLMCRYVDYFYELGERALNLLDTSDYYELVEDAEKNKNISHHDFNHHNIFVQNSDMYLINFEYCCYDLKVYDLVNLLRRKMRKCQWDIDEAALIINEYSKIESLSESELDLMKLMLMFPQKFWRVINKYYNSRKSWSEQNYISRLEEVIDEVKYLKEFLEKFSAL